MLLALFLSGCVADTEHVWRKRHCKRVYINSIINAQSALLNFK